MKRYINHEGYADPTACEAVERAEGGKIKPLEPLMYFISETPDFREARRIFQENRRKEGKRHA